jgi:hypothetical protein
VDVPEPSPLFWDHLAARVGEAIAHEPPPRAARPWWAPRLAWAAVALAVTAVAAGYVARRQPVAPAVATSAPVAPTSTTADADSLDAWPADPAPADDGWHLIAAMADEAPAEMFAPQPGQADLSIATLTAEERAALAVVLEAELAPRPGRAG